MNKSERQPHARGFDGIVGQKVPTMVLSYLVGSSRLPGTLLFSGPGGTGKLATAVALAKRLHCKGEGHDYCDCDSCAAIRAGNHPDVIVLSRDKLYGVEELREIVAMTGLRSAPGQERVIIIDRAENITQAGANAALKTLEEPGEHVRFILVTDTPSVLLSTVRSRSYNVRFSLLSDTSMAEYAVKIGDNPSDALTRDAIVYAKGRPGRYLRRRHSAGYSDEIEKISEWVDSLMSSSRKPSVEAVAWKESFRKMAEEIASIERNTHLPRGADAFETSRWLKESSKFPVSPINWRVEDTSEKDKRWGDGRRFLLLAGILRQIISLDKSPGNIEALAGIQDFMVKVRMNCSFDIVLERLYFRLAGILA